MRKSRILTVFLALAVVFTMSFAAVPAYAASGTAITSVDDLKAMENNPGGSYYLANDIEVPEGLSLFTDSRTPFTGTLTETDMPLRIILTARRQKISCTQVCSAVPKMRHLKI